MREPLCDSAAMDVRRGRNLASRCSGATDVPGSQGRMTIARVQLRVPQTAPALFHFTKVPPLDFMGEPTLKGNQQQIQI